MVGLSASAQTFDFSCSSETNTNTMSETSTWTITFEGVTVTSAYEIIEHGVIYLDPETRLHPIRVGIVIQSTPTERYKHGRRVSLTADYVEGAFYQIFYTYDEVAEASTDNQFWSQYSLEIIDP